MTREVIEIESKDADRVHILAGTIVSTGEGIAEVDIDDYGIFAGVPVFYHCEESETADGMPFIVNDRVLIVNSGDAVTLSVANMKVVGFEDGLPRKCCLATEKFTTGDISYTWESYVTPPQSWGWVVDNTTFNSDKMLFDMTFKFNYVGTVSLGAERFIKGFDSEIVSDPYLIIYNLPGWGWSGGTPSVITQFVNFFVVFQHNGTWFEYFTRIYRHSTPEGLPEGVYYVDIFKFLRDQGSFPTEGLTLKAYGIKAGATDRFVTTAYINTNIDQYNLCFAIPSGATKLDLNEHAGIIADPSRYQ